MNPDQGPADAAGNPVEYTRLLVIGAPREAVFDAIAPWTAASLVDQESDRIGSRHRRAALRVRRVRREVMVMHVTTRRRPSAVAWSCMDHTRNNEWAGTLLEFRIAPRGPAESELEFRHSVLPPELVAQGWDHFLASPAADAETGTGTPFGQVS